MRNSHQASSVARGMTLVELMIVISMLAALATFVVPMFGTTSDMARTEAMASNAAQIRSLIIHHAGARDVPLSIQGYPQSINGAWFTAGKLPEHAWSNAPILVEVVSLAANQVYPATKSFDPTVTGAKSAWYNTANGHFVVRVPARASAAGTLTLFNAVNKVGAASLNQTTQ